MTLLNSPPQLIQDLEQVTALHEAAAKTLSMIIEASAHYAVELNPHDAGLFRQHLTMLASQVGQISSVEEYDEVRSSFRGELRDYRGRASDELTRLRDELKAAAAAMQTFAAGLTASADEHEAHIKQELDRLRMAGQSGDPAVMSGAIDHAIQSVSGSCDEMKRGNQMVVAQLQDELRALHQEIEKERRALYTDRSSGVWNRHKIDNRIEDLIRMDHTFCLLMVGVKNLRGLYAQYSRTLMEDALKALLARLSNLLGDDAMIGRWSEDVFAVVLDATCSIVEKLRLEAELKLTGGYAMQENGLSRKVVMNVSVGMVEREKAADAVMLYPKLAEIAASVVEP